jgi:hypothetical protein
MASALHRFTTRVRVLLNDGGRTDMRRLIAPLILLFIVVVNAPTPAQALVYSLLPDFLSTSEPAALLLTGIALLGVARFGVPRNR